MLQRFYLGFLCHDLAFKLLFFGNFVLLGVTELLLQFFELLLGVETWIIGWVFLSLVFKLGPLFLLLIY